MGLQKAVVLIALVVISTCSAFNHITPSDKEVIYTWNALVKAGTDLPTPHASLFMLNGKIHLQSDSNSTHVKITDLTYKLYNGILDHVQEQTAHSVPVHIDKLQQIFKVVYNTNGLAVGIVTETQDKEFSRNIKKAIATILQMDESVLKQSHHQHHHPYSVVLKEHSVYGWFDVDYTINHHENGDIVVHKLHDMKSPEHLYQNLVSNTESNHCDVGYENPLMHYSNKQYSITKQEGHHIVKEIEATGAMFYQPFKAQSDHQFVYVNQTFHLVDMVPIQQRFHIQNEHFEDHLTYHSFTDTEDGSIHDVTNGRHVVNYDKLIPTVQHMLEDVHQYLQENHIHTKEPESKRGQLINRIQRMLQWFSTTKMPELHKKLTGDALTVFHHMLPLVGTKASVLFIKHLVVNKAVPDDVAIMMLQHFPEHVVEPTVTLLTELEELMNLGDNIHWNVKKTALLSFATLIHKSHTFEEKIHKYREYDHHVTHVEDNYNHQQPYEKYVVEYINKLRSSHEQKVQMAYAFALSNMKLHSIIQHMLPAVEGGWYDNYHFRHWSLWAMGPSVVVDKNPHTIIETMWPIFTDVDEITEMRLQAFSFIMEHHVTPSIMMNMYEHLLHEPNEEVYSFVYTYLQQVANSKEPCYQEYSVQIVHLLKLLPPPTHGTSFVHIHDYKDVTYGFSEGVYELFANGNHSLMFGFMTTSQQFNVLHEDLMIYVKIHGIQQHGDPVNMLIDAFKKKNPQAFTSSDKVHIEFVVLRHGHVVGTYLFDQNNLHELDTILNFFTKDSHSLIHDFIHVSYDEYHRAVIPNDLGIPMVWEYLMPTLHHNNITMTKETVNKVINIHIDNKYVNWMHYRHGLTFYNPFADVWQGINRFHSFDTIWPLRLDVTLNTVQQSMQLSWTKPSNVHQAIGGLRSHVKQMVFVKDDHNTNVLVQSSPQSKEFVIVTNGKQFHHEYPYIQDDDLSTGHHWYVALYDSNRYTSNGSFYHIHSGFSESHIKNTETPLDHLVMSYSNWVQFVRLLPSPGSYGFIVKIEPSQQHVVTDIDLSLRLHSEPVTDESFHYCPKIKWSTRMTYSVKNKEKSLKTWDVNSIIDMNPGHTINNLKMQMTRIVPGLQDYKICVDGMKKWSQNGIEGHLNVAMSQSPDGKCVKDDTVIDVTMTGQKSHQQIEGKHKYGSCQHISPYSIPHTHSLQCLVDHTTVRHYVYNVKTTNVPSEFRKTTAYWWDILKGYYMTYYSYEDEHNEKIADHSFKVDIEYPMEIEAVDVHVTTPQHVYTLTGVPIHYWKWFGVSPDSVEYPKWLEHLHEVGFVDHCVVENDHFIFNQHQVHHKCSTEWTPYVENAPQNPQWGVYIKQVEHNEIAVKIVDHEHTVEIVPHGANHQITLDGKVIPVNEYHHEDWVYCHVFLQDTEHPVAVMLQNSGIHVEYHHHQVVVVVPKVDKQLHGQCYSHH